MTEQDDPTESKGTIVIGNRASIVLNSAVEGSITNRCQDCGESIWLSPSSLIVDATKVVCLQCALKLIRDDNDFNIVTNEIQKEELKKSGFPVLDVKADFMACLAWEAFIEQSPTRADLLDRKKWFWAFGKKRGTRVALLWTNGREVEKGFEYENIDEAIKGMEALFIHNKDNPDGWKREVCL